MKKSTLEQKKAAAEAKLNRINESIKVEGNQRLKLLGLVAEKLLVDNQFKTAFINKALETLTYSKLKKLKLTDRYGNDIAERLVSDSK